jgi:hypothetical protein
MEKIRQPKVKKKKYKIISHYNLQVVKNKMPKRGKSFSISTLQGGGGTYNIFWLGEKREINGIKLKTKL